MTTEAILSLQAGAVFGGRYRVVRRIKAGGMGAVYEVVDERTNSPRALKVMLPSMLADKDLRARFALEAKVTGNVVSDHVVKVSDAGIDESTETPFIVMELLHGEELGSYLTQRGMLPPDEVVVFLRQTALALDKTHAAGIVHRDLKPENLYLTRRDDGSPCVKILDFGIAKVVAQSTSQMTRSMGTPIYMSPEQVRGDTTIGPRTDLFTLGHIAYTLLTGEPYWHEEMRSADSVFPLLTKIVTGLPEPPTARAWRRRGIQLPPHFDGWMARACAVRLEERFDRATTQIGALGEVLGMGGAVAAAASGPISGPQPGYPTPAHAPRSGPVPTPPGFARPPAWSDPSVQSAPVSGPLPGSSSGAQPAGTAAGMVATAVPARSTSAVPLIAAAVLLLGLAGGGFWFFRSRSTPAQAATASATPVSEALTAPPAATSAPPAAATPTPPAAVTSAPPAVEPAPPAVTASAAPPSPEPLTTSGGHAHPKTPPAGTGARPATPSTPKPAGTVPKFATPL
jgi:serine/threonine-protein kinase